MAKSTFFGSDNQPPSFDLANEYRYLEQITDTRTIGSTTSAVATDDDVISKSTNQFALLEFEKPVTCPAHSVVIGSRLDVDAYSNTCRIAFHGELVQPVTERDYVSSILPRLKIFKMKSREGIVERVSECDIHPVLSGLLCFVNAGILYCSKFLYVRVENIVQTNVCSVALVTVYVCNSYSFTTREQLSVNLCSRRRQR